MAFRFSPPRHSAHAFCVCATHCAASPAAPPTPPLCRLGLGAPAPQAKADALGPANAVARHLASKMKRDRVHGRQEEGQVHGSQAGRSGEIREDEDEDEEESRAAAFDKSKVSRTASALGRKSSKRRR